MKFIYLCQRCVIPPSVDLIQLQQLIVIHSCWVESFCCKIRPRDQYLYGRKWVLKLNDIFNKFVTPLVYNFLLNLQENGQAVVLQLIIYFKIIYTTIINRVQSQRILATGQDLLILDFYFSRNHFIWISTCFRIMEL